MNHWALLILVFFGCSAAFGQTPLSTPPSIREEVTVTANRIETRIADTPASVVAISSTEIAVTAAPTIDEVLRQSVGFSIFRRTGSRVANPTTQGVSLRGVGSSGASRTIVLFDGVPLNDPFGGWIQWNRVVPVGVDVIEVRRGGSSSLYGNAGLSGAVVIKPRDTKDRLTLSADVYGGMQRMLSGSVFAGFKQGAWSGDLTVGAFNTRGYIPIDETVRGPVDDHAGVRSSSFSLKISRSLGLESTVFLRSSYFSERRENGTSLQTNQTHTREAAAGGDHLLSQRRDMKAVWRAYAGTQVYDQVFTAVNAARNSESLTRLQRVPAQAVGGSGYVSSVLGDHVFLVGADARSVRGASDEVAYFAGNPTSLVGAGGRENSFGIYLQDFVRIGDRLIAMAGMRYDRWRNYAASAHIMPLTTSQTTSVFFPGRFESAFSPQVSVLAHITDAVSVYAAASRSFRAPTLNELYRGFRVGNVQTLANENLTAERAANAEAGIRYGRRNLSFRSNVFWTGIDGPVSNVTLAVTPSLITRQRQNAGRTRSAGIEIEGNISVGKIDIAAGYLFADSIVINFPANPVLVGSRVPQVARHQFTLQTRLDAGDWTIAVQARGSSSQFDDDLNIFRLEPYGQLDVYVSRRLSERLRIYTAIENIFNSRYSTGRTPTRMLSSPINFRIGIRYK